MSRPVDVLAVIRQHERFLREKTGTPLNELAEVHAAVTELISQRDKLLDALRVTTDTLAEVYAKYSLKIGPFASQCQKANGIGRAAIAKVQS